MIYIILGVILILIDQITKFLVLFKLKPVGSFFVIKNIFHLTYVENRGAAFGIMQDKKIFFVVISIVVIGFIFYYLIKNKNKLTMKSKVSFTLIVSGALGNMIDRLRLSYVVDFFDFIIWPVFNIADICVVLGCLGLVYLLGIKGELL